MILITVKSIVLDEGWQRIYDQILEIVSPEIYDIVIQKVFDQVWLQVERPALIQCCQYIEKIYTSK